jgi:lambda repressor-like predicted transcriptional regulator
MKIVNRLERRDPTSNMRGIIAEAIKLKASVLERWPERYPVPPEIDQLHKFVDFAIASARKNGDH